MKKLVSKERIINKALDAVKKMFTLKINNTELQSKNKNFYKDLFKDDLEWVATAAYINAKTKKEITKESLQNEVIDAIKRIAEQLQMTECGSQTSDFLSGLRIDGKKYIKYIIITVWGIGFSILYSGEYFV